MLYSLLKPIVKAALRLYFGRIVCNGLEIIDRGGPMIILANHTASFMDAILVATFVRRRIHFFARGDVFSNRFANRILRSLGLMPVYRLSEGRDKLQLNDTSNDEALKILSRGGAVLIFAEGVSDIAKVLKPLKKGPFRLAATAAATLPEAPLLIPLGINYSTPTQPFGNVFLNTGEPLRSDETALTEAGAMTRAATDMMRRTAAALQPLIWDTEQPEDGPLAEGLLAMLGEVMPRYSFAQSQLLFHYINHASDAALRADREDYERWQRGYPPGEGVYDKLPSKAGWIGAIIGLPFAIGGFAWNFLPIMLACSLTDKKVAAPDFRAPVFVAIAVVFMLLWWLLILFIGARSGHIVYALAFMAAGAICGLFYLKIYRPLARPALGPLRRLAYRRLNDSYPSMERYRELLKEKLYSIINNAGIN